MKNINNKKGISLIVLVITIVVMIILAGIVIIKLTGNKTISKSKTAVVKSSIASVSETLNSKYIKAIASSSEDPFTAVMEEAMAQMQDIVEKDDNYYLIVNDEYYEITEGESKIVISETAEE